MSKFKQVQQAIEKKEGMSSDRAAAIAAAAGRKKYGNKVMAKASAEGKSAESVKRRLSQHGY